MAIATLRCIQTTAIKFLSSLSKQRVRKKGCVADGCLEGMPIPAQSIPTRAGAESLSTGTSTELDTHGRGEARPAPILTRGDRTQREKCCAFSSGIRFHSRAGLLDALGTSTIGVHRTSYGQTMTSPNDPKPTPPLLISQVLRQRRAGPQFAATALSYGMMCHADGVRESFTCSSGHPTRAVRSKPC